MTAQVAWQYPLNQYSFWGGNVVLLQNGDIEICASEPVAIGSTVSQPPLPAPGERVGVRGAPRAADTPSQVLELANGPSGPEIVWQMKVLQGGAYRSYRIPSLYPGVTWSA